MKKYALNCHLKNKTDELCKKTTVCVVLANCPISLLTVQKSIRSEHLDGKRLSVHSVKIMDKKNNG